MDGRRENGYLEGEVGMDRQNKAIAKVSVTILSNVAAIGIGIALYEQRWWCFIIATVAALIAVSVAWRSEQ